MSWQKNNYIFLLKNTETEKGEINIPCKNIIYDLEEEENSNKDNDIDNNKEINKEKYDEYNLNDIEESGNKIQEKYKGKESNIFNIVKIKKII